MLFFVLFICCLCLLNFILLFRNPVYAVFCFICFILFIIFLLLFLQVEFLAYLLLIIYVGAIAVLFLFTIILLNIKDTLTSGNRLVKELFFIYTFFLILCYFLKQSFILFKNSSFIAESSLYQSDTLLLSFFNLDINVLISFFTTYYFLLFVCILILFVGIVGTAMFMRKK